MRSRWVGKTFASGFRAVRGASLRARSARGVMKLGIGTTVEQGSRFIRNMILTRVLAAEHLGLMAVIMAMSMACEAFTEVGVKQSVIQNKKGATLEYMNAAWWVQGVRAVILYSAAFLLASLMYQFYFRSGGELSEAYDRPEMLSLFRVAFLSLVFKSLVSPRAYVLEKKFRFGKSVFLVQGSGLAATLLTIVLVFWMRNVWALVIGFVSETAILCLLSYILCPFVPRLRVDKDSLREVIRFARGMFGLPVLTLIAMQTDIMVLGRVMPMVAVGMYSMAIRLAQMSKILFARMVFPVLLPAFSERQDDRESLCGGILKMTKTVACIGLPLMVCMSVYARPILGVVYGGTYTQVAIPFGLLSFCMLFSIQGAVLASVYFAIGRPELHRRFVVLLALIIVSLMYPGVKVFGLAGSATVVLSANAIALFAQVLWMGEVIGLKLKHYISCWLPGVFLTPIVFVPSILLSIFESEQTGVKLFVGGLSFLVACGVFLLLSLSRRRINFFEV